EQDSAVLVEPFVPEVVLAFKRPALFFAAQNILFELPVDPAKGWKEISYFLSRAEHFLREIVSALINTDRADHSVIGSKYRNRIVLRLTSSVVRP
ncbi:MAG: hypothetical protein ACR2G0_05520, partial [Chthoniobacterales bacterium]